MIEYTKKEEKRIITLSKDLSIEQAKDLIYILKICLRVDQIDIVLKKVQSIDLAILQILYSAQQTYISQSKKISIDFQKVECVKKVIKKTGINLQQ